MNTPVAPLKIGQVHALLRQVHPNLELSKIRYYEEMGLVEPARSRKGYRLYTEKDVQCLREAIRLADEEFVPLRVIRVRLIEQGLLRDDQRGVPAPRQVARTPQAKVVSMAVPPVPPAPPVRALSAVPDAPEVAADPADPEDPATGDVAGDELSTVQLLEASRLEPDLLNKVLSLGLITPRGRDGEPRFTSLDVAVAQAAATLLRDGADPRLLGALRRVVERQVGIIDDLTAELRGSHTTAEEVTAARLGAARDVESLRAVLFQRALGEFLRL